MTVKLFIMLQKIQLHENVVLLNFDQRIHTTVFNMIVTRFEGQGRKDEEVRGDEPEKGCLITQNKQQ